MAMAASGAVWLLPVAALLMGIGYGPTGPASSRILYETAPPRHRMLIFSIKQAGAPAGGALAGLVAAPVAAVWGWQAALWLATGIGLVAAVLLAPLRGRLDAAPTRPVPLREAFTLRRLGAPLAALRLHPVLPPLTLLAFAFAALQGSLMTFTVTWLVETEGMAASYTPKKDKQCGKGAQSIGTDKLTIARHVCIAESGKWRGSIVVGRGRHCSGSSCVFKRCLKPMQDTMQTYTAR